MTEVFFYHLERARVEDALPQMLDKSIERGWRAVVQTTSEDRVRQMSDTLWGWRDDAFLAHGSGEDKHAEHQPVWLTTSDDTPNEASIRFMIDGSDMDVPDGLDRFIIMFDGHDDEAVQAARAKWKEVTGKGLVATYWQQNDRGGWDKKATSETNSDKSADGDGDG